MSNTINCLTKIFFIGAYKLLNVKDILNLLLFKIILKAKIITNSSINNFYYGEGGLLFVYSLTNNALFVYCMKTCYFPKKVKEFYQ